MEEAVCAPNALLIHARKVGALKRYGIYVITLLLKGLKMELNSIKTNKIMYKVKKSDLVGDVKDFPIEVVQKMLEEQVEQGNDSDVRVFQKCVFEGVFEGGFAWSKSEGGYFFWSEVLDNKDFDLFFKMYPKRRRNGIFIAVLKTIAVLLFFVLFLFLVAFIGKYTGWEIVNVFLFVVFTILVFLSFYKRRS